MPDEQQAGDSLSSKRDSPDAQQRLEDTETRYRTLVESLDVGFCVIQMLFDEQGHAYDYRFLEANPAFERHTGLTNIIGRTAREFIPDHDEIWFESYGRVALTGEPLRFEDNAAAMGRWFEVDAQRVGNPDEHLVAVFFNDVSARKAAEEALRESEARLRDAQTHLASALLAGDIGTWSWDIPNNRIVGDEGIVRLFSVAEDQAQQGAPPETYLKAVHPDDRPRVAAAIDRALNGTGHYQVEYRVVLPDGSHRWLEARGRVQRDADGKAIAFPGLVVDITERVERERREKFLTDLAVRVRSLLNPDDVLYETAKAVAEFTSADRGLYIEIDEETETLTVRRDFVQPGIPSMAGIHPLSAFGEQIVESLRSGRVTQIADSESAPRLSPEHRAAFRSANFRSFLAVPLHKAGRWVAVLALHQTTPRSWSQEEADLLAAVIDRTWLAVENARLFRETRQRAEREALLNQIGAAVRAELDPEQILQAAFRAIGDGLQADRCYFVRYNQTRDHGFISTEWMRADADLEPIAGRARPMSNYSVNRDPVFRAGRVQVVNDTQAYAPEAAAPLLALKVRALVRVPIEIGDQMTALGVAMAYEPRVWTRDDVLLIENVATLVRSALESAYVRQRERNIAQQLQDALVPAPPPTVPGLSLAHFYRSALQESSVGGDFFDVFDPEDGCTAVVVSDLSGKGLAAASQTALVRNMLRFALYNGAGISESVWTLHRTLVEKELLTGFATLFVGLFDHADRTLTYVNCGQEPALIYRAESRFVERLGPTGPVLGGFAGDGFEQRSVALQAGDVVTIFTDGLTEVGPSRKDLLRVDGVSDLLAGTCAEPAYATDPRSIVDRLVAEVTEYARGGIADDIALLVGVVQ